MKKVILSGMLVLGSLTTQAQTYTYASATGWNTYANTYTLPSGCTTATTPQTAVSGSITIGTNLLNFNAVKGAQENRMSTLLGSSVIYDQEFNMDFDMNITSTSSGKGIFAAALTSADLNPVYAVPMTVCAAAPNMDMIGVSVLTPTSTSNANLRAQIAIYDNGTQISPVDFISLSYGTTYYVRVQIHGNEHGELLIYSNSTHTALVGSFCFAIPRTVRGLRYLQHATNTGGGTARVTTGWVDNTSIYRVDENCCDIDIKGTNVISGASTDSFYDVTTTETSVIASISPAGVTYTQALNGDITVTDWGTLTDTPKVVTITVTAICQCEEISSTFLVYVYPTGLPLAPQPGTPPVMINTEEHKTGKIFPNPTTGMITIENEAVMTSIILSDSNGKVLETVNKNAERATVDLSARPAGLYFIRMITENGEQLEQVVKK